KDGRGLGPAVMRSQGTNQERLEREVLLVERLRDREPVRQSIRTSLRANAERRLTQLHGRAQVPFGEVVLRGQLSRGDETQETVGVIGNSLLQARDIAVAAEPAVLDELAQVDAHGVCVPSLLRRLRLQRLVVDLLQVLMKRDGARRRGNI